MDLHISYPVTANLPINPENIITVILKLIFKFTVIEIRYSSAPSLTRGNLIAINDLKTLNNFIIIPESIEDFQIREDVVVSDLETFLTKYLPKI